MGGIAAFGSYSYSTVYATNPATGAFTASYMESATAFNTDTQAVTQGAITADLTPNYDLAIVPTSVRFTLGAKTYYDDGAGNLYTDLDTTTGAGTRVGTIDYSTGTITLTAYPTGSALTITLLSILARRVPNAAATVFFRTSSAPIRNSSMIVAANELDGTHHTATADTDGNFVEAEIDGNVDIDSGIVSLRFGHDDGTGTFVPVPIDMDTLDYSAVLITYIPLSADILGLDPTRLPIDGRVPIFRPADIAVIHNTQTDTMPTGLTAGQTVSLSRSPASLVRIRDQTSKLLPNDDSLYTVDLTTGVITMATPLDLSAYTQPLIAEHRQEDMRLVTGVQINGLISLQSGVAFDYAAGTTRVSSALVATGDDLAARVVSLFTQKVWTNVWQDSRIDDDSIAKYNDVAYPLLVDNHNAITESWAMVFTGNTTFNIVGDFSGVVGTGTISTDTAPINPFTSQPYFTILAGGWGSGWVSNNVLRFNTFGATQPAWLSRTTESGPATFDNDQGKIETRGDAN